MGPTPSYWGNPYHLLCASPLYSPTGALGKPLPFTMCFPTLFPDGRTGETPIIYYVLPHPISRFSLKTRMDPTRSYWGNPYHLLCASPFYSPADALGKPLSFTMCFPIGFILFPGGRIVIGETPIIYYVLLHSILRRARFSLKTRMDSIPSYWGNPNHLLCASPSYFSIFFENTHGPNPLLLGKPLPFTMCFPTLFPDGRTGETPTIYYVLLHPILRRARFSLKTRLRTQPALTGETPIIYYVLPHRVHPIPRRAHCHWGNPYYLLCASPSGSSYSPAGALSLGKPLLFTMCFSILFSGGLDFL